MDERPQAEQRAEDVQPAAAVYVSRYRRARAEARATRAIAAELRREAAELRARACPRPPEGQQR